MNIIGIVGGDLRQKYISDFLQVPIAFYGNDCLSESEKTIKQNNLQELFSICKTILLPIPFSKDKKNIHASFFNDLIPIDEFIKYIHNENIFIGGPFSDEEVKKIKHKGAMLIDITKMESFKFQNAISTSEGVLLKIMNELDTTIHNTQGLVLGYGYCGKRITNILSSLGATIDIFTENKIETQDIINNKYNSIEKLNLHYDYIINTIPKEILANEDILEYTNLFIDITEAYQMEENIFMKMRGIPGKYSPKTAGIVIGEIVNDLFKKVE